MRAARVRPAGTCGRRRRAVHAARPAGARVRGDNLGPVRDVGAVRHLLPGRAVEPGRARLRRPLDDRAVSLADAGMMLPQTGVARLLTAVHHCDATSIRGTGEISGAHPLVSAGRAPAFMAIELGAQAAAAMTAVARQALSSADPLRGRLVRVKHARFVHATLPAGTALAVTARLVAAAAPLAIYDIEVWVGDEAHVTATLSTFALPPQSGA